MILRSLAFKATELY